MPRIVAGATLRAGLVGHLGRGGLIRIGGQHRRGDGIGLGLRLRGDSGCGGLWLWCRSRGRVPAATLNRGAVAARLALVGSGLRVRSLVRSAGSAILGGVLLIRRPAAASPPGAAVFGLPGLGRVVLSTSAFTLSGTLSTALSA